MRYRVVVLLLMSLTVIETVQTSQKELMHDVVIKNLKGEQQQLGLKFKMANYLLMHSPIRRRIKKSNNEELNDLFDAAEFNFELVAIKIKRKNWIEANAIIDSVIRDLTNVSRMLSKKRIDRNKYLENSKRVESFIMPAWSDLSKDDRQFLELKNKEIVFLVERSTFLAKQEKYVLASESLIDAYKLKSQLLVMLKHENTVVYDLLFDSSEEEFNYLLKRSMHYLELVEGVLQNNSFNKETSRLIDSYVQQGTQGIDKAQVMKKSKQHEKAVLVLDKAIKNLSGALKIMGVRP